MTICFSLTRLVAVANSDDINYILFQWRDVVVYLYWVTSY